MNLADVTASAAEVASSFGCNPEAAMSAELAHFRGVLEAIAAGGGDQGELAEAALQTRPRVSNPGHYKPRVATERTVRQSDRRRRERHHGEE